MPRYALWDKQSPIYTIGKDASGKSMFTAEEYIRDHANWAGIPGMKVIVGGGPVNGTVFMEFETTKEQYTRMGAAIEGDMTDAQVLAAIEDFENNPPASNEPTAEERIAAALEFNNLLNM
ncbi:MAG: hypothetical protein LBV21_06205 [Candidatus Adiutrix sp.]|jgi:hypothetical protein|nr:hypothetical protein [Candidatus Adiutrix sp.]